MELKKRSGPKVSIGLPVYNGQNFLEEALISLLDQTYKDIEIIISDNQSTDRTNEICVDFVSRYPNIRYHRNETNMGAAFNYMKVLELSKGEYFKWAAHDDIISPTFIEKCVHVLDSEPDVILCYSKAKIIDEFGNVIVDHDPGPDLTNLGPHKRFKEFMFSTYLNIQLSGLLRADILRKTNGYGKYPASDEILSGELSLYGKFFELPDRIFYVRMHKGQSTFGALIPGENSIKFKQRDQISWFNPNYEGKIILPTWLYYFEGLKAVTRSPITPFQKMYCVFVLARRMLVWSHFKALGKDIYLAGKEIIFRLVAGNKKQDNFASLSRN